jgi:hypothetical protein
MVEAVVTPEVVERLAMVEAEVTPEVVERLAAAEAAECRIVKALKTAMTATIAPMTRAPMASANTARLQTVPRAMRTMSARLACARVGNVTPRLWQTERRAGMGRAHVNSAFAARSLAPSKVYEMPLQQAAVRTRLTATVRRRWSPQTRS